MYEIEYYDPTKNPRRMTLYWDGPGWYKRVYASGRYKVEKIGTSVFQLPDELNSSVKWGWNTRTIAGEYSESEILKAQPPNLEDEEYLIHQIQELTEKIEFQKKENERLQEALEISVEFLKEIKYRLDKILKKQKQI